MLNSKTIVAKMTKEQEAELKAYISHYRSSNVLSKTDEFDILDVFESAITGKTKEAVKLFEELETHPRELFAKIILKKHQGYTALKER